MRRFAKTAGLLAVLALLVFALPLPEAFAGGTSTGGALDLDSCAPGFQPWDLTSKIVYCVQFWIVSTVGAMMGVVAGVVAPAVNAAFVLAVVIQGMRMLAGESHFLGRSASFIFRIGMTCFLFNELLPVLPNLVFGTLMDLLSMIPFGGMPWQAIDRYLGKLVGVAPNLVLFQGIIGLLGAAAWSSSMGSVLFLAGFAAIFNLLMFVFSVVYTYLMAITMIAFMLVISPIFIPMAMFHYSERYIKKWMDITIGAVLTPVLMFAFLWMFMPIFGVLIGNIFYILGFPCPDPTDFGSCTIPDLSAFWRFNQPVFGWLMPADATNNQQLQGDVAAGGDQVNNIAPVQLNVNPNLQNAMNANMVNAPGIDFGANTIGIIQQLIFALITLWIFASIMKTMMAKIPGVASTIAGTVSHLGMHDFNPMQMLREAKHNIKTGTGAIMGGVAGHELGGAVGKANVGRQAGALVGSLVGSISKMQGRRDPL